LEDAVLAVVLVGFDGEPGWEPSGAGPDDELALAELVAPVFGFDRAARDLLGSGVPLLEGAWASDVGLRRLREVGLLELEHPSRLLLQADEVQLALARLEAGALEQGLLAFAETMQLRHGRDVAGVRVITTMSRSDRRQLRLWLTRFALVRTELGDAEIQTATREALEHERPRLEAVLRFLERYPGYTQFFRPGGEQVIAALPEEARQQLANDIRRFASKPRFTPVSAR